MSVYRECCVLSGRGLCDELITRPEEFYRLWCVIVCDIETSWMRRPLPTGGCRTKNKKTIPMACVTPLPLCRPRIMSQVTPFRYASWCSKEAETCGIKLFSIVIDGILIQFIPVCSKLIF
jgi:hypothetical protein